MTDFLGSLCRPLVSCFTNYEKVGEFLDPEEILKIAKPADLIEFERKSCVHWGMYVGDGGVIHFSNLGGGKGQVDQEELIVVAKEGKCRVNNQEDKIEEYSKLPGFNDKRDSVAIIEEARRWLHELHPDKELTYDLFSCNCEHVCTKWKYGVAVSQQVEAAALIVAGSVAGASTLGVVGGVAAEMVDQAAQAAKNEAEAAAKEKLDEDKKKAEEESKGKLKGMFGM